MSEIRIPFNDWSRERLKVCKCATSRNKRYGKPGDTFSVDGQAYRILNITKAPLWRVAEHCWMEEGADSPSEFIEVWNEIHPRKHYNPKQVVWYHEFEPITD